MKRENNGESDIKSKRLVILAVIFLFILILTFFFGDSGIIEIIKSKNRISELKKDIEILEKEKVLLQRDIEELEKSPMALEKRAREKLWLMKKNEKVIVIVNKKDKEKKEKEKK